MKDLVSIVTPAYNCSDFIRDTIQSVLNQTFTDWEMIVVDDCSSDNTYRLVKKEADKDDRIKIIKNTKNVGPAKSRNKAIKEAKGTYIAFLDGDDFWLPNKLEYQLRFMKNQGALFSFSSYLLIDEKGKSLKKMSTAPAIISYRDLIKFNWIGTSTVIYNSQELDKQYMPHIRNRQDWACWLQLSKLTDAYFIGEPLVKYRVRKDSISSNKVKMIYYHWKIYREIESLTYFKSINYLIKNILRHFLNRKIVDSTKFQQQSKLDTNLSQE